MFYSKSVSAIASFVYIRKYFIYQISYAIITQLSFVLIVF